MLSEDNNKAILEVLEQIKIQILNIEKIIKERTLTQDLTFENKLNPIFKGKIAFIGNYDYYASNQLKLILENFGMNVSIFKTGSEILEKIKDNYICCILSLFNISFLLNLPFRS